MNNGPRVIAERYRVVGELGRGAMGVVWRAEDMVLHRQVALKELFLPPGVAAEQRAEYLERAMREARTAGRLNDPGIVTVYDIVRESAESALIVMELVEAPTLAEVVHNQGPLSTERVIPIALRVLSALDTAHVAGIVHRDVKPGNIMLLPDDQVKLTDFGIARATEDPALTMTGAVTGSPAYMAPELFDDQLPSPAADLWALGATLAHAVEGRSPFQRATTAATLHAVLYEEPRLELCREPLASTIRGLLTRPVDQRLTSPGVRAYLLSGVAPDDERTQVLAPTAVVDKPPSSGRRRLAVVAAAVVAASAVVAAVVLGGRSPEVDGSATGAPGAVASEKRQAGELTRTTSATKRSRGKSSTPSQVAGEPAANGPGRPADNPADEPATGGGGQGPEQPGGDAADPADPPQTTTAPPSDLLRLGRFVHESNGHHYTAAYGSSPRTGYHREGPVGWIAKRAYPNTKKFYACRETGTADYFSSVDQTGGCEGETVLGSLGFIFTKPPADGYRILYRCNRGASHFDSLSANCEGEKVEGGHGYVLP